MRRFLIISQILMLCSIFVSCEKTTKPQGQCSTPIFNPSGGSFSESVTVLLSCATRGATIRYTTNGSTPTSTSSIYSIGILLANTMTIKAKAYKNGMTTSNLATGIYTYNSSSNVATPTLSPGGGSYSSAQYVYISCTTSGATIRYTTDGSTPTSTSTVYSSYIIVSSNRTIKAKAYKTGLTSSNIVTGIYTFNSSSTVATPTLSPSAGTYSSAQHVYISCATSGSTIRYTTDGSTPTSTSAIYSSYIIVSSNKIIKAKAFKTGLPSSNIVTGIYTISSSQKVAKPSISPRSQSSHYLSDYDITIFCSTYGAEIRYYVGSDYLTNLENATLYRGMFNIEVEPVYATYVSARAYKDGMQPSDWVGNYYLYFPEKNGSIDVDAKLSNSND